jgi:hypothetical protein
MVKEHNQLPLPRKRGEGWGEGLRGLSSSPVDTHLAPHPVLLPAGGEKVRTAKSV